MTARLEVNPRHQISEPDADSKTGTCSHCGPTRIYRAGIYKGRQNWRCGARSLDYALSRCKDPEVEAANRNARFLRLYGITIEEYDRRFGEQGGTCARCKTEPTTMRLAVDHCHKTGAVRGLLCGPCNTYIGRLEANMHMLIDDMAYLSAQVIADRL